MKHTLVNFIILEKENEKLKKKNLYLEGVVTNIKKYLNFNKSLNYAKGDLKHIKSIISDVEQ